MFNLRIFLWWHQTRRNISLTLSLERYSNLLAKYKDLQSFSFKNIYVILIIVYESKSNWLLICIFIIFLNDKINFENKQDFLFL
jgi:hypothetical protein